MKVMFPVGVFWMFSLCVVQFLMGTVLVSFWIMFFSLEMCLNFFGQGADRREERHFRTYTRTYTRWHTHTHTHTHTCTHAHLLFSKCCPWLFLHGTLRCVFGFFRQGIFTWLLCAKKMFVVRCLCETFVLDCFFLKMYRLFYRALLQKRPVYQEPQVSWLVSLMGWLRLVGSLKL